MSQMHRCGILRPKRSRETAQMPLWCGILVARGSLGCHMPRACYRHAKSNVDHHGAKGVFAGEFGDDGGKSAVHRSIQAQQELLRNAVGGQQGCGDHRILLQIGDRTAGRKKLSWRKSVRKLFHRCAFIFFDSFTHDSLSQYTKWGLDALLVD